PFALLAVVLSRLQWSRLWMKALYVQLTLMALVFAIVGIYQWRTRDVFWNPKVIVGNAYAPFYRVNSVFWDPSIYGRFLVVAILASLVVALSTRAARVAVVLGLAVAATWVGLLLSFSQSSFVALAVGVLAAAAYAWQWRVLAAAGLAAVVLVSVGFAGHNVFGHSLNRVTSDRYSLVTN